MSIHLAGILGLGVIFVIGTTRPLRLTLDGDGVTDIEGGSGS